jgi:serine/threonine-protein kinase RsbW
MVSDNLPWTLTLPSELRLLPVVRAFLEGVCQVGRFDPTATHAVLLATTEAVSNVIRHAHCDQPEAPLQLQCYLREDGIEIRLLDEGKPFDLGTVPHLDPGELRLGGRGVFLMRALMDEVTCQPRPERGNALRMVKRYAPPAQARDSA